MSKEIDALTETVIEAQRDSIAMAAAAARDDATGVAVIWNGNRNHKRLIWHLSRLPWVMTAGLAGSYGEAYDFEGQCKALLRDLPHTVEDVDRLINVQENHQDQEDE